MDNECDGVDRKGKHYLEFQDSLGDIKNGDRGFLMFAFEPNTVAECVLFKVLDQLFFLLLRFHSSYITKLERNVDHCIRKKCEKKLSFTIWYQISCKVVKYWIYGKILGKDHALEPHTLESKYIFVLNIIKYAY